MSTEFIWINSKATQVAALNTLEIVLFICAASPAALDKLTSNFICCLIPAALLTMTLIQSASTHYFSDALVSWLSI